MPEVRLKRVYDPPQRADGTRILVDRLWPRGVSRETARIDHWLKDIAPSTELRKWYDHDPDKWTELKKRYFAELDENPEGVAELRGLLGGVVTLLYAARSPQNNAAALKEYLDSSRR